ncbi:class II aldolase/adducin family protein [Cupriavidus taiwanensis]|nr:class II aldolase/adducin family protein [Cupriavidus taiwanensis]
MQRSVRNEVSAEEWEVRCELAALYRLLAHFKMTDIIYTHISARLPGDKDTFLINRYGVLFDRMRASDLVRIDVDGNILESDPSEKPVNRAGFTIHSAIHQARHDAKFVIHTHTQAGIAVSAQKQGLLPITQHALKLQGILAYHDYEGIAVDLSERERLARDLGKKYAMILRNHGLLTVGRSAAEAFSHVYYLERSCQIQLAAQSGGAELLYPSEEVIQKTADQWHERNNDVKYFQTFWDACLQLIEDDICDYRT